MKDRLISTNVLRELVEPVAAFAYAEHRKAAGNVRPSWPHASDTLREIFMRGAEKALGLTE